MRSFLLLVFTLTGLSVFAQSQGKGIAPGAREQLATLLNTPTMVQAAGITPLASPPAPGRNWFKIETDAHVITDQVSFKQVEAALVDVEGQGAIFNGNRSKLSAQVVGRDNDVVTLDYITTAVVPGLGIQIRTPYRATLQITENTASKVLIDIKQTDEDSLSNKSIQRLIATRYAEEITIDGKIYTYIRIYTLNDSDARIALGAQSILQNNAGPVNVEALQLVIAAAKNR